jgi:hypothetical protein
LKMDRFTLSIAVALFIPWGVYAQKVSNNKPTDPTTSQAYSLLIQRRVKVEAEMETLLTEYDSDWPRVKKLRHELDALKLEMKSMREVADALTPKLTSGYGGLILRKVSLTSEIQSLLEEESPEWPPLKEKQRELELLEKQIQKVLQPAGTTQASNHRAQLTKKGGHSPASFHFNEALNYGCANRARLAAMARSRARGTTSMALAICGSSLVRTCTAATVPYAAVAS